MSLTYSDIVFIDDQSPYVQIGNEVKAVVLGVVARGTGCGNFNSPAIFGSVVKSLDWIQETIINEKSIKSYCAK